MPVMEAWKLPLCTSQQRPILATGGVVPRYLALFPKSASNIPESTRIRSQRLAMVEMFPRVSTKWYIARYPPRLVRFGAPRRGRVARVSPKKLAHLPRGGRISQPLEAIIAPPPQSRSDSRRSGRSIILMMITFAQLSVRSGNMLAGASTNELVVGRLISFDWLLEMQTPGHSGAIGGSSKHLPARHTFSDVHMRGVSHCYDFACDPAFRRIRNPRVSLNLNCRMHHQLHTVTYPRDWYARYDSLWQVQKYQLHADPHHLMLVSPSPVSNATP
jgi:hypothetical protein